MGARAEAADAMTVETMAAEVAGGVTVMDGVEAEGSVEGSEEAESEVVGAATSAVAAATDEVGAAEPVVHPLAPWKESAVWAARAAAVVRARVAAARAEAARAAAEIRS